MELIRKVSVGSDYKNAMHYIMHQDVLNGNGKIHLISRNDMGEIQIWIENNSSEVMLWKSFGVHMPVSIEFNIDF